VLRVDSAGNLALRRADHPKKARARFLAEFTLSGRARFFAPLRMTSGGLRMTSEGLRMVAKGSE